MFFITKLYLIEFSPGKPEYFPGDSKNLCDIRNINTIHNIENSLVISPAKYGLQPGDFFNENNLLVILEITCFWFYKNFLSLKIYLENPDIKPGDLLIKVSW